MVRPTHDELMEYLREQVGFLRSSAMAFDSGSPVEAKRIAHTLRLLLHQTGSSHALLEQLGVLSTMTLLDSGGEVDPYSMVPWASLTCTELSDAGAEYAPLGLLADDADEPVIVIVEDEEVEDPREHYEILKALMDAKFLADYGRTRFKPNQRQLFTSWWNMSIVRDNEGTDFSRRDLVWAVANRDGGSHVDELKAAYVKLSRSNSLGWIFSRAGDETPLGNPVLPTIRQIAYEVDLSLGDIFPEFKGSTPTPHS